MGSPCPHDRGLVAAAGPGPHPAAASNTAPIAVSAICLTPPDARAARDGVVAYASIEIASAISIQATVLRDLRGRILVRMPTRRDRSGRRHPQVTVLDPELRDRIDDAVALAIRAAAWADDGQIHGGGAEATSAHSPPTQPPRPNHPNGVTR